MVYLLLLAYVPLSFANPQLCGSLANILSAAERTISQKPINDCRNKTVNEILGSAVVRDRAFLEGKLCQDHATIEAQLEKLRAELAVAEGIKKLVTEVEANKAQAANRNPQVARAGGLNFVQSLETASSLELLLSTELNGNGTPLLQRIREAPENRRSTPQELTALLRDLCKDENKSKNDACNPRLFRPGSEAARELLALINGAEATPSQIESWRNLLSIRRRNAAEGEAGYSFIQMQTELSAAFAAIDSNNIMTREHLNAIRRLDDFEYRPGLAFVERLRDLRKEKNVKILSDQLYVTLGDARLRAQYDVQSKISITWENYRSRLGTLPADQVAKCAEAKRSYEAAKECRGFLEAANRNVGVQALQDVLAATGASATLADQIQAQDLACQNELKTTGALSERCFSQIADDPAVIADKIMQLNLLKDRIGSENRDQMTVRNFALLKWSEKCGNLVSTIDQCDGDAANVIPRNAMLTVSDSMAIALLYSPTPTAEEEAREYCEDDDKPKTAQVERTLCAFFNPTPNTVRTDNAVRVVDGPTSAPDGGHDQARVRDALIEGGSRLLGDVLGHVLRQNAPPTPAVNPYPYTFGPFNGGTPPMGVADQILFNARYHGAYGFYMPTPGYQAGAAFGPASPLSSYQPVSGPPSRYFGR